MSKSQSVFKPMDVFHPVDPDSRLEPSSGHTGDEQPEKSQPAKCLIGKRERLVCDSPSALALVIDGQGQQPEHRVTVAQWSVAALAALKRLSEALGEQTPRISIPSVSLRGRLEVNDQSNLRIDREVGYYGKIILWTQTEATTCSETVNSVVLEWLINDAADYAHSAAAQESMVHLKKLARSHRAVEASTRVTNPYKWNLSPGKTAKALSKSSYADLADYVVRQLEGKSVFPELGGLRRIAGGQLEQNQAELMTEPIQVGRARFSLVVRVRVFSFPGRELPVITIHFTRRVWTNGLKKSSAKTISGYALPEGSSRALRFTLRRQKAEDGTWTYQPDDDFAPISRRYFPGNSVAEKILKQGHQFPKCKLMVVLKHGAGERSEVKSGVPDLDKMEGYSGIVEELAKIGLKPWHGLEEMTTSVRPTKDRDQHWSRQESENLPDQKKYQRWLKEAQENIRDCYAGEHHLIIAVQTGYDVEADTRYAEDYLHRILGDSIVTKRLPISPLVHGSRNALPGKAIKDPAERAALRAQEWSHFIETVRRYEVHEGRKIDGVLVIAHEWYPDNQEIRHDDNVNQRVARITLATGLGVPVQYLRPREEPQQEAGSGAIVGRVKRAARRAEGSKRDFENRLMISWLDLAYKSLGRVRPAKLQGEADKLYGGTNQSATYPDRILSLGVVRRNKSRFLSNERSFLPCAVELDVKSGVCSASFAYEDVETRQLRFSEPLPLPQALVLLASLGPVPLTTDRKEQRSQLLAQHTQSFFKSRLADVGRRSERPLVIIDADTTRSVWPWLTDGLIDPNNVQLAGNFHAEAAWPHARLVRVRSDNSPKVLWDGEYYGTIPETGETIRYHAPSWAEAQLFKLTDTSNTNVYLSFGSAIRTGRIKGRSSYRKLRGMKAIGLTQKFESALMEEYSDAWATPAGLEIMVIRPHDDDPDQVARLVEWLRQCYAHFGEWSVKPAPLFFERVLKEYIADYNIEEGDEDQEDDQE